ncbi:non-ribosomal peptide synthetase [Streptomyces odontomachi]|uniref:non-ribosomal peptide synthetase n=1 Tax=Streptomyces odontomachi TaxID=2944940 RepID=UPI00210F1BBD|nr:amino acid adenylation domain-containing protein [Streptomyces sp. ODS25]
MIYEFPVSPAQARLLVLDRIHPGTAQYNVPVAFAVEGPFDVAAFGGALDALVARHESLRTVFRAGPDGAPVQVVAADGRAQLSVERNVPADDVPARLLAAAARPFDLAEGPLLRCTVYALAGGGHRVLLVVHHIVCDGWSLQLMLRELSTAYAAGSSHRVAEPELQYPDFAAWQHERLAAGGCADAVAHWARSLRGAPAVLPLPADRPLPARRTTGGGVERFVVPRAVRDRMEKVAREHGGTPFMALFAAFAAFLGRLCGREDLVVGVPVSGRDRPELHDMVGMLVNTLAVRVDLSGDPSYGELIGRLRAHLLAGQRHQDAPFEAVVEAVAPDRVPGYEPLVQVMFAYDDDTEMVLSLPGAEVRRLPLTLEVAKFDLLMFVDRWGEDLVAEFVHATDLLAPATVRRWVGAFRTLLDGLLAAPEAPLSTVGMLPQDELADVLRAADRTAAAAPPGPLVPDLVAARATARPDAVAVVSGDVTLTYRQLLARADALADRLRAAGVGPEVPVGLLLPRSAEVGMAALAVLRAGGAYVPLDPGHPRARLAYMVRDSGARLLVAAAGTVEQAEGLGVPVLRADVTDGTDGADGERDEVPGSAGPVSGPAPGSGDAPAPRPGNLAYILYTSGSTGTPKGVAVEHRALANLCGAVRPVFGIGPGDRVLQYVNSGFDVAVSDLFFTWTAGAELHIAGPAERLGEELLARLAGSRISYVFLPPSAAMSVPEPAGRLPCLRTLAVGGEACPPELLARWAAPGLRIVDAYGPSEATVYATTADLAPGRPVVIGRPVPGARVQVLDARLRPVPVGVAGEIYVAGASLGRGYAGRPALTAERFVPDPYGPPGSRMYRTGDLGKRDVDGVLHYLGRVDTQVKVRGFRIELGEIESVLAQHPEVAMAAVTVRGAADDRHLVAYVVGAGGHRPEPGVLRAQLSEQVPGYMVPERVVHLDALPLNRSGKVDRARLPDPPAERPEPNRRYAEPATGTERRVADVWARVLGHDRIGVHDNFFDLGGNSVRLLAVLTALRAAAGPGEPSGDPDGLVLVDLFRHTTVAALAAHLDRLAAPEPAAPAAPDPADALRRGQDRRARLAAARAAFSRGTTPGPPGGKTGRQE